MAFYGESYEIDLANNVSGTPIAASGDRLRKHFDGLTDTIVSGESFIVGGNPAPIELPVPDDAIISWVIETEAASSGTLRLSSGLEPDWSPDNPDLATEPLGDFTVSGVQTIVALTTSVPVSVITDLSAEPILFVECVAGTVELNQVKLRVWPAGGAGGAWVDGAAYETTGAFQQVSVLVGINTEDIHHASPEDADADAKGDLSDAVGVIDSRSHTLLSGVVPSLAVGGTSWALSLTGYWFVSAAVENSLLIYQQGGPVTSTGPDVTSPGFDPNEIPSEGFTRGPDGGDFGLPSFLGWAGTVVATEDVGDLVGANAISDPGLDYSGFFVDAPFETPSAYQLPPLDLSGIDSPALVVGGMHPEFLTIPTDEYVSGATTGITDLYVRILVPPYQWFDPEAVPTPERPDPKFFVRDWDYSWAPVGFGKPPEEVRLFHTWTPLGMYRDLTTAEYDALSEDEAPVLGYPLYVKLEDETWEQVAWMVPVGD